MRRFARNWALALTAAQAAYGLIFAPTGEGLRLMAWAMLEALAVTAIDGLRTLWREARIDWPLTRARIEAETLRAPKIKADAAEMHGSLI